MDYEKISRSPVLGSGNRGATIDYILTLDAAKHIAMVEKNDMGRLIRSYFIWVEKNRYGSDFILSSDTRKVLGGMIKSISRAQFKEKMQVMEERLASLLAT